MHPMATQRSKSSTGKPSRAAKKKSEPSESLAPEPNLKQAEERVLKLMAIPGRSTQEGAVAEFIVGELTKAGAEEKAISFDTAHKRTGFGGDCGNLVFKLPGRVKGSRRMLMAHMDTVPICVGSQPVRKGEMVTSGNPETGLGADDRAGVAVTLTAAVELLKGKHEHPPLTFLWTVQEETGLHGARCASLAPLSKPKLAFNFDGGSPTKLTIGATGSYRMEIVVRGIASHAGGAPEKGVSAIAIAGMAIADLHQHGWHGDIQQNNQHGTSNIGIIEGGQATNVVTDLVRIRAEARSHNPRFRHAIVREIESAFRRAAKAVKNVSGDCGTVEFSGKVDYEAFRLPTDEPCVAAAEKVMRALGEEPERAIANGGLDANWLVARGIPTVTMGCGQINQHMTSEGLDLKQYRLACRIALALATGA